MQQTRKTREVCVVGRGVPEADEKQSQQKSWLNWRVIGVAVMVLLWFFDGVFYRFFWGVLYVCLWLCSLKIFFDVCSLLKHIIFLLALQKTFSVFCSRLLLRQI